MSVHWFEDAIDHVRHRPETYVGALQASLRSEKMLCFEAGKLEMRTVEAEVSPVLLKMLDELVTNAIDNSVRSEGTQTFIKLRTQGGVLEVSNDGAGISLDKYKDTDLFTPEVVFTKAFAGSNFDDTEDRVTGGRNGIGVKAVFVFSRRARVEVGCMESRRVYTQEVHDNLRRVDAPKLARYTRKRNIVSVAFEPDLGMLTMGGGDDGLSESVLRMLEARAIDACACVGSKLSVYVNDAKVPIRGVLDYAKAFFPECASFAKDESPGLEVAFCVATEPRVVSFVNGCKTGKGGTHVDFILRTVAALLQEKVRRRLKKPDFVLLPRMLRDTLSMVASVVAPNPRFTGQLKEALDSPFRVDWKPSGALQAQLDRMCTERICAAASAKADQAIAKEVRNVRAKHVEKYSAAGRLGRKNARCTLLVTEGDSAKALAVAGLAEVGRDLFGVFPLRGKIINVLKNSPEKVHANKEMRALTQILGLRYGHEYTDEDAAKLPYAHVAIFSDQDTDGSHIAGLFLNWLHGYYHSLLRARPDFVKRFATPLIKVWTRTDDALAFFSEFQYRQWLASNAGANVLKTKYYKGLGTSSDAEAREYFRSFDEHTIRLNLRGEGCDSAMRLFFDGKCADERKAFLAESYDPDSFVEYSQTNTSIERYLLDEMSHFSAESNRRAIASAVDGLKPVQRKIAFTVLQKAKAGEVKVSTLAAHVAQATAYHHGDDSLKEAIVNLAQRFVGRNNLSILEPLGQFGSRAARGDHAAYRYISTQAARAARALFPADDDPVLEYLTDEGQSVEPRVFVPVVPLALLNGAEGIGCGWSTFVPNYSLSDLIANVRRFIRKEALLPLVPAYSGFRGTIVAVDGGFVCSGAMHVERNADGAAVSVVVTELPIGDFIDDFEKRVHEELWIKARDDGFVTDVENMSTNNVVHLKLRCNSNLSDDAIFAKLKLSRRFSLQNMVLHDARGKLHRYTDANEILVVHAQERLRCYADRKAWKAAALERELAVKRAQREFVNGVVSGDIDIFGRSEALRSALSTRGFAELQPGFSHLLNLPVTSLTKDRAEAIAASVAGIEAEVKALAALDVEDMWEADLRVLEAAAAAVEEPSTTISVPKKKRRTK